MEIIMTLIALIIIWCVAFLIGAKQGTNRLINQIKKDGGYYDTEVTSSVYPICGPTSSVDEVPTEFLMGGDIDRALHIAGVKEASFELQQKWRDERNKNIEEKSALNDEQLMKYLEEQNEQLLIKAGIKPNNNPIVAKMVEATQKNIITLADIATPKSYDPLAEEKKKIDAARKEADRMKKDFVKRNFEALPLSRLSVEGMSKIIELVREDIQNQVKEIEKLKTKNNERKKVRQGKAVSKVTQVTKETKQSGRKRKLD